MDYVLHVSSFGGIVPGAKHYRGRVEGEHPRSCHGGTVYHGSVGPLQGKTTCADGHELAERITWNVEASWTHGRYKRWSARHFDGPGPEQFTDEAVLIETARRRFLGTYPRHWWEDGYPRPQPGDVLYLGHVCDPQCKSYHDPEDTDWGMVVAAIPAREETPHAPTSA